MKAEISFDLIMGEDMPFVEGCFRLDGGIWKIFIVNHSDDEEGRIEINRNIIWSSGVTGLSFTVSADININKSFVVQALSKEVGFSEWVEIRGPDSINLR